LIRQRVRSDDRTHLRGGVADRRSASARGQPAGRLWRSLIYGPTEYFAGYNYF